MAFCRQTYSDKCECHTIESQQAKNWQKRITHINQLRDTQKEETEEVE